MRNIDTETQALLRDPAKRRAWVRYQLQLQGLSMAQVAANAGVTRNCIYLAFIKTYPRMEKIIADAVGLKPKTLWPERYNDDGLPIYRMGRPKKSITNGNNNSTPNAGCNVDPCDGDRQESLV